MARLIHRLRQLRHSDERITAAARATLVESLYASPQSLVIGALTSSVIATVVAAVSRDRWLTACAAMIGVIGVVRIVDAVRLYRQGAEVKVGAGAAARRQERGYRLGALSYAGLLGLFGLLTLTRTDDGVLQLLAVTTAIGTRPGSPGATRRDPRSRCASCAAPPCRWSWDY